MPKDLISFLLIFKVAFIAVFMVLVLRNKEDENSCKQIKDYQDLVLFFKLISFVPIKAGRIRFLF